MEAWLEDNGEEAEVLFYEVAAELDPEDFEEFEELLSHPDLLGDMPDTLEENGLLKKKKKSLKRSWDDLLDLDSDDVASLAEAVSKELGEEVTVEDMEAWLEDNGEEAEVLFYEVAAELDPEDFEEFEELLSH